MCYHNRKQHVNSTQPDGQNVGHVIRTHDTKVFRPRYTCSNSTYPKDFQLQSGTNSLSTFLLVYWPCTVTAFQLHTLLLSFSCKIYFICALIFSVSSTVHTTNFHGQAATLVQNLPLSTVNNTVIMAKKYNKRQGYFQCDTDQGG